MTREKPLFNWRHCVVSSKLPATRRHVLLTLSMHMNEWGKSCFPSTKRLAYETGLSERSICTHLEAAASEGWIVKKQAQFRGQKWKANEYEAALPLHAEVIDFDDVLTMKGTERGSAPCTGEALKEVQHVSLEGTEPNAEGTEPNDKKALKEVQCSTSLSTSKSTSKDKRVATSAPKLKIPDWLPADKWEAYVRTRRSMKKHPMSDDALGYVVRAIEKTVRAGFDLSQVMDALIENGWRTVTPTYMKNYVTPDDAVASESPDQRAERMDAERRSRQNLEVVSEQ